MFSFLLNMTFSKQKKISKKNGIDIFENILKLGLMDNGWVLIAASLPNLNVLDEGARIINSMEAEPLIMHLSYTSCDKWEVFTKSLHCTLQDLGCLPAKCDSLSITTFFEHHFEKRHHKASSTGTSSVADIFPENKESKPATLRKITHIWLPKLKWKLSKEI